MIFLNLTIVGISRSKNLNVEERRSVVVSAIPTVARALENLTSLMRRVYSGQGRNLINELICIN